MQKIFLICAAILTMPVIGRTEEPENIQRWLQPQPWQRDTDAPILSLGQPGNFDDTHILAPCVAYDGGKFWMWYCGAQGNLKDRVYHIGLAISDDGIEFNRFSRQAILQFDHGTKSIKTPTLLRNPDSSVLRENGKLRMWFVVSPPGDVASPFTLHEVTSEDGIHWSTPSPAQLDNIYAPTIIKEGNVYRLWYADVRGNPWIFRYAQSHDGQQWDVRKDPVLVIDQAWETARLFYPTVLKADGLYLMWYGSYWAGHSDSTAIGFAVSNDGLVWRKHHENPVFRPDPDRPWESHYTTSQSVMKLPDGTWRMWYASRKKPPQVNKYFAINTATWDGPPIRVSVTDNWNERADSLRNKIAEILNLPDEKINLDPRTYKIIADNGYTIEPASYASEPGSRVTALLYLPQNINQPVPAVIVACGHGGSKSCLYAQYAGQLYAKLGFACLAVDTIGDEERSTDRKIGAREHDLPDLKTDQQRREFVTTKLNRMILGKIVWDLLRGIDYLQTRTEINPNRIGIMGYSMGGASAGCLTLIEPRIKAAVICGWGHTKLAAESGKPCTKMPYEAFAQTMSFGEMTALSAPHCATLFLSGDQDTIIDANQLGRAFVQNIRSEIADAERILNNADVRHVIESQFVPGVDHRPLFLTQTAVEWFQKHLMCDNERLPISAKTIKFGDWADSQRQKIETLYNSEARERGNCVVDIGAVYHTLEDLAVLPIGEKPAAEYTFEGWCHYITHNKR